jgi:hypothetical protein
MYIVAGNSSQETGNQTHAGSIKQGAYSNIPVLHVGLHML